MQTRRAANACDLLAVGIFGSASRLGNRIEMLLSRGREFSPRPSLTRVAASGATMLGLVFLGSLAPRWIAFAQEPAFDAASVKASKLGVFYNQGRVSKTPGRLAAMNAITRLLIREAYGVKDYQVSGGPGWLNSDRFDVEGKADGAAGDAQLRAMLRTLLAERFKLTVHRETRETQVYVLVAGKNGPTFPEEKPGEPRPKPGPAKEGIVGRMGASNMPGLADMLSSLLARPVLDKTGLTGSYFIDLQYGADENVFTAIEDHGLKLDSAREPIEVVVIEHAEKPSEN